MLKGSTTKKAFVQFRELAKPYRLRVQADAEGWPLIPGRYGQIEWYCDGHECAARFGGFCALPNQFALAVYTDRLRLFEKLWAIPGVRRHQTGDQEMRAVFPPEALEQVATVIKARRKRTLSPEAARKLGAPTAYRATSASYKATFGMRKGDTTGTGRAKASGRAKTDVSASPLRPGVRGFSSFKKGTRGKFLRGVSSLTPHASSSCDA